jgi:Holliday junction resolvase
VSLHRRNPRRDGNEIPIVRALEAQGFHVTRISGAGVPDLLVSKRVVDAFGKPYGWVRLVEVKMPKGRFKPAQIAFREAWQGPAIVTLRSVEDALRFQLLAMEQPA